MAWTTVTLDIGRVVGDLRPRFGYGARNIWFKALQLIRCLVEES